MSGLLVVEPLPFVVMASRGSDANHLTTPDPKEVWSDVDSGTTVFTIDLGREQTIDTVFLGYVLQPAAEASWLITAGRAGPNEQVLQPLSGLRVPDAIGTYAERSHALWRGSAAVARYLGVTVTQPAGSSALTIGVLIVGLALTPERGHEWGSGRRPIDTASVTSLPSGGFAVVRGARKRALSWTFGDLLSAEVDQFEALALSLGESATALVVEDATRSAGLWSRCHYGLFKWRAFERRNKAQTRWEMELEEWV